MKILGKIIKIVAIFVLLIVVFNRVAPHLLGKDKEEKEELSSVEIDTKPKEVALQNEVGTIVARPIEYGNWILYLSDEDALLEESFNELGMLTCDPEFELFLKSKIQELRPDFQLDEEIINFSLDCFGYYEIHLKGEELVQPFFAFLEKLYISKETLNQESKIFKNKVKACLSNTAEIDSYICRELKKNPLPAPKPRYLQQEDGSTVPMKGFTECYDSILSDHKGEFSEKVSQDAELACYSSW